MAGITTQRPDELVEVLSGDFLTNHGWADFTPTVDQGGAVAATVTFARYVVLAQSVMVEARLAVTAAGAAGNAIEINGLPVAIRPANVASRLHTVGTFIVFDATGNVFYSGVLSYSGADTLVGIAHNNVSEIGITPNFALANGDFIGFSGHWER